MNTKFVKSQYLFSLPATLLYIFMMLYQSEVRLVSGILLMDEKIIKEGSEEKDTNFRLMSKDLHENSLCI